MSIHNITKEMLKELGISPNLKAYKCLIKFFEIEANLNAQTIDYLLEQEND